MMTRRVRMLATLMALNLASCSDDGSEPARDTGVDAAAADSGGRDLGRDLTADTGPDRGTDSTVAGCSSTTVGKACSQGGSECGKDHTCVLVTASKGFCSCACTEEVDSTVPTEDTCPGSTQCASITPHGGSAKKPYCLVVVGGSRTATSSWWAASATTSETLATQLAPATAGFTVLAARHLLVMLGKYCDIGLAHRLDLVVSSDATPASSPTVKETFSMAKTNQMASQRTVTNLLSAPLELASGEHIFALLELTADAAAGTKLCVMSASQAAKQDLHRADTGNAPYTWKKETDTPPQVMLLGY